MVAQPQPAVSHAHHKKIIEDDLLHQCPPIHIDVECLSDDLGAHIGVEFLQQ